MAVNLKKDLSYTLQTAINNAITSAKTVKATEQARKEADFQKLVSEGTMSYAAQIEYRQKQLQEEQDSPLYDDDYVTQIQTSIGTLKKMNRYQTIRTKYKTALDAYIDGKGSLDQYINVLEESLNGEVSEEMRTELIGKVSEAKQQVQTNEINALKNRVTLAEKDKSIPTIDGVITDIANRKAKAQLSGNTDEVAMWDATLSSLYNDKSTIKVENSLNELTYQTTKNGIKGNQKLNVMTGFVDAADGSAPFTYNGVRYTSEKAFWEQQRGNYISTTYLTELKSEIDNENATIAASSKSGQVPLARIKSVSDYYNQLKSMPIFAPFIGAIDAQRVDTVTTLADNIATVASNEFEAGKITESQLNNSFGSIESALGIKLVRPSTGSETPLATDITKTKIAPVAPLTSTPTAPTDIVPAPPTSAKVTPGGGTPQPTSPQQTQPAPLAPATTTVVTPPTGVMPATPPASPSLPSNVYVVKAGDNLSTLAQQKLGNASRAFEIKAEDGTVYNQDTAKKIQIGTRLIIPQ